MSEPPLPAACPTAAEFDESAVTTVELKTPGPLVDYREAMTLAEVAARQRLGEAMLIAWYDRDRDFESPQHASECHQSSAVPGYVDYALNHGATLRVVFEEGRFVFYFLPIDL